MRTRFIRPQTDSQLLRYGVALLSVLSATLLTSIFSSFLYPIIFPLFFGAVIISAWYGGFKPGAVATALSVLVVYLIFINNQPGAGTSINTRLSIFVLLSLLISWLSTAFDHGLNAVREREKWFQEIFEGSRDAIFLVQSDSKFVEANRAACELTGYTREELLSMRIPDLHDDEDLQAYRNYFDSIMGGQGVISEAFIRRKDGMKVPVEFSNSSMTFRGKPVMHTTARDITERKRAEEKLRARERQLATAQHVAHLGSWEWDITANKVTWSDELYCIYGLQPQEFDATYEAFLERVHPFDQEFVQDVIAYAVRDHKPFDCDHRIIRPDGTIRALHGRGEVIVDESGKAIRMIGIGQDITERKLIEERLRESEDRYRDLVEHSQELICTHDLEGRILSVNPWAERALGYDRSDLTKMNIRDILAPEARDGFDDYLAAIQRDGFARGCMVVETVTGERRIWEYNNSLRTEGVDEPIVRGIAHDVTERRRAEQALQESEKRYKGLADSAFHGVMIHQERVIKDANLAYAEMFGYELQELIGQDVLTLTPPEQRDWVSSKIETERDTPYEALGLRKDGSYINIEVSAKSCLYEGKPARLAAVRDITRRKQEEDALRRAEEKYHSIFENAVEGIFQSTPEGKFISINPAMARMYGYQSPEEMIAERTDIGQQHYVDPESRVILKHLLEESDLIEGFEAQVYRRDKSRIWTSENVRAVRDATGKLLYYEGTIEDITKRKNAEKAREQLLKAREQLLRRLVTAQEEERRRIARELHDQLGQQITALILGLKWLKDSGYCQPQATEYLSQLQEYTDQLGQEVHNIAWELRPTALDDLGLHTALGNYLEKWSERSGKAVQFHLNGFNGQRLSTQIETAIYRIIQEALTNVLKHARADCISLILERRNNHVLAILEDDGCGFDVEAVINTTESERKLGLLGMRERLALVFGTLDIESTPGAGTTLFVRIPTPPLPGEVSHL